MAALVPKGCASAILVVSCVLFSSELGTKKPESITRVPRLRIDLLKNGGGSELILRPCKKCVETRIGAGL